MCIAKTQFSPLWDNYYYYYFNLQFVPHPLWPFTFHPWKHYISQEPTSASVKCLKVYSTITVFPRYLRPFVCCYWDAELCGFVVQWTESWVWTRCPQETAVRRSHSEQQVWRQRRECFEQWVNSTRSLWPNWWPHWRTPTPTSCAASSLTTRRGWDRGAGSDIRRREKLFFFFNVSVCVFLFSLFCFSLSPGNCLLT